MQNIYTGKVMLDLQSTSINATEQEILRHPNTGGVIYFSRNFESVAQISELSRELKSIRSDLLIAIDQEGGRVQRFKEGFYQLPTMAFFGELYQRQPQMALQLCQSAGWIMAQETKAVGIDISFAPVLDIDYGNNSVIGDRAFANNAQDIQQLAAAFITGMHAAKMAATAKHFPGHGYVCADSHLKIAIDKRQLHNIEEGDMLPFVNLLPQLEAIMPAHIIYPALDTLPAGFSKKWLTDYLRHKLKFNGVIFSDDLSMQGAIIDAAPSCLEAANLALNAGVDMVLVCNNPRNAEIVVEKLSVATTANKRLATMFGDCEFADLTSLQQQPQYTKRSRQLTTYCNL